MQILQIIDEHIAALVVPVKNLLNPILKLPSLKLTFSPLKNGWLEYVLVSFWVSAYFQGRKCRSFQGVIRECLELGLHVNQKNRGKNPLHLDPGTSDLGSIQFITIGIPCHGKSKKSQPVPKIWLSNQDSILIHFSSF